MRVLFLLYGRYPNEPRTRREAERLAQAGHQVTVFATDAGGAPRREVVNGVVVERFTVRPGVSANPVVRKAQTFAAVRGLHKDWATRANDVRPEIVQAQNLDTLHLADRIARVFGAKLVYDAHELWVEYQKAEPGSAWGESLSREATAVYWASLERRLLSRADLAMTVNDMIADEMARRYRGRRPEVVLNVPSTPPPGRLPLPVELPGVRFFYAGVLSRGRGLEEMIEAIAAVPEASIVVYGDGPLREQMTARVKREDLARRAYMAGVVPYDEVIKLARSADVGVVPFVPTTMNNLLASPNKLFEYMHAGLAIAASDLPFIATVLERTGAGLTFRPGDPADMASAFRRLAVDADIRSRFKAASAVSAQSYSWEREGDRYLELYDRLAVRSTS